MHKEDIKAELRKRFKTLLAFEIAKGLKAGSVKDALRGRRSAPVENAIAEALAKPVHKVFPQRHTAPQERASSTFVDDIASDATPHCLSRVAR